MTIFKLFLGIKFKKVPLASACFVLRRFADCFVQAMRSIKRRRAEAPTDVPAEPEFADGLSGSVQWQAILAKDLPTRVLGDVVASLLANPASSPAHTSYHCALPEKSWLLPERADAAAC